MIYLKTLFSAPWEINFIKLNMLESFYYVDFFIVCEFNRTHRGEPREFIFKKFEHLFSLEEKKKLLYLAIDLSEDIIVANNSDETHRNEQLMRGAFVKFVKIYDEDIIFSVDADEIIDARKYSGIIKVLAKSKSAIVRLPMRQFFYKVNFLWDNLIFKSAIACKASYYLKKYPAQWRDAGNLHHELVGSHFSWCMSVDEMLQKMGMYSHCYDYAHLRSKDVLEAAIKDRKYPFDPSIHFNIKTLDIFKEQQIYPASLYELMSQFDHLVFPLDDKKQEISGLFI